MKSKLNSINSKDLVEYPLKEGFYYIPYHNWYAINREGLIWSIRYRKFIHMNKHRSARYHTVVISDDNNKATSIPLHRLLASVFLNDGTDRTGMQVDHIDGNRNNNSIENLEWVTPSENVKRSFKLGLRDNKAIGVLLRDWKTKKVFRFMTLNEAAEFVGSHYSSISTRCKNTPGIVYPDGYQYKFESDKTPWVDDISEIQYGINVPVLVKDHNTGTVTRFERSCDAAKYLQVSLGRFSMWLNDPRQLLNEDLIQIKPDNDSIPWREVGDPYEDISINNNHIKPVIIHDTKTGKDHFFTRASYAAAFAGILTTTLNWRLKDKDSGKKVYPDGYTYRYYTTKLK